VTDPANIESPEQKRKTFRELCDAECRLYVLGKHLHDAVDRCQHFAVAYGLVDAIGQDEVQFIMACAFGDRPGGPPKRQLQRGEHDPFAESTTAKEQNAPGAEAAGVCAICRLNPCQTPYFCQQCQEVDAGFSPRPKAVERAVPEDCQFLKKAFGNNTPYGDCACGWPEAVCAFHEREQAKGRPQELDLPPNWDTMDVDRLWDVLNAPERQRKKRGGHAPQVTYDAVQYALRTHGLKALGREERRLTELSERQLKDLIVSLNKAGAEEALLAALARILPHDTGNR
jgi:hypothetical protein